MGKEQLYHLYSLIYFPTKALTWEIQITIDLQDPTVSEFKVQCTFPSSYPSSVVFASWTTHQHRQVFLFQSATSWHFSWHPAYFPQMYLAQPRNVSFSWLYSLCRLSTFCLHGTVATKDNKLKVANKTRMYRECFRRGLRAAYKNFIPTFGLRHLKYKIQSPVCFLLSGMLKKTKNLLLVTYQATAIWKAVSQQFL